MEVTIEVISSRISKEKIMLRVKTSLMSQFVNIKALVDTGNSLHDPLTNIPVVIVEYAAIKSLLPIEIYQYF